MPDQSSASLTGIVGHDRVTLLVGGLLRSAKLQGWTDESLSAAAKIPALTIKSYRTEGKEPSLSNALSLGAVLGKEAINGLLALIGYGGAHPLDEADELEPARVVAALLPHVSTIAAAAADGRIDHIEQPACQEAADHIIATVMPLSSAGRAA